MQEQETLQLQSLKSTLLHITTQRKIFPLTNPGPRNRFLCWLNNGIRDALSKNYLHQIILTVYTERNRPDAILESYTITVAGRLCEKRPDKDIADVLKMLAPLPRTRYLSMRLVYNETCPDEYEPEGFKRADYEYVMNGNEVLVKDDIKIESRLEIKKEKRDEIMDLNDTNGARNERVVVDDKIIKERGRGNEDMAERHGYCHPTSNGDSNEERKTEQKNSSATTTVNIDVKATADSNTNICAINNSNVVEGKHQRENIGIINKSDGIENATEENLNKTTKFKQKTGAKESETASMINCICRINHSDLDMLQCDKCNAWSHTVCCGFFSNNDKRIPQFYTCNICLNNDISRLALYRRALSVNYNEEILSVGWLGKRLGVKEGVARRIVKKLLNDGFIEIIALNTRQRKYVAVKNENVKKKVKKYFYIGRVKHSLPIKDISMAKP